MPELCKEMVNMDANPTDRKTFLQSFLFQETDAYFYKSKKVFDLWQLLSNLQDPKSTGS